MSNSNDRKKLLAKLHEIQKEVEYMQKDGRNSAQGYNFLSERQITETFKGLLEKHGILFYYSSTIKSVEPTPSGKQVRTDVEVQYAFVDVETGESHSGVAAGQGTDANDKGVYKAITGAIKYVFMKTFMIPTGDDPEEDTKEERKENRAKAAKSDKDYGTSRGEEDYPSNRNDVPFGGKEEED